jgi:hypothetical protein
VVSLEQTFLYRKFIFKKPCLKLQNVKEMQAVNTVLEPFGSSPVGMITSWVLELRPRIGKSRLTVCIKQLSQSSTESNHLSAYHGSCVEAVTLKVLFNPHHSARR